MADIRSADTMARPMRLRMISAAEVMRRTGLGAEAAMAIVKAGGVQVGRRWYISEGTLAERLNGYAGRRIG